MLPRMSTEKTEALVMPGNASCDRLAARNEAAGPDRAAFGHTETCKAVSGSVAMTDVTAADGDDRCRPASARVLPVLFHGFHTRKAALSPVGLVRRWARRCAAQRVAAKTVSPGSVSEACIEGQFIIRSAIYCEKK